LFIFFLCIIGSSIIKIFDRTESYY
jgi:hypothetical protein